MIVLLMPYPEFQQFECLDITISNQIDYSDLKLRQAISIFDEILLQYGISQIQPIYNTKYISNTKTLRDVNFTEMRGEEYYEILDESLDKHEPFCDNYLSWVGCMAFEPKFKEHSGFFWQTFYSITIGALIAEKFELNECFSKTESDYDNHFVTCGNCATHSTKLSLIHI